MTVASTMSNITTVCMRDAIERLHGSAYCSQDEPRRHR